MHTRKSVCDKPDKNQDMQSLRWQLQGLNMSGHFHFIFPWPGAALENSVYDDDNV